MRKIVLNRDVENLGAAGEVVEVKDGYARNYLVPRGYAVPWTRGAQRHIDQVIEARRRHEIASVEDAIALRDKIDGAEPVVLARKAGSNGRLFGAVTPKMVAQAFQSAFNAPFDSRKVDLFEAIKTTGTYTVSIRLHSDVTAKGQIKVIAE